MHVKRVEIHLLSFFDSQELSMRGNCPRGWPLESCLHWLVIFRCQWVLENSFETCVIESKDSTLLNLVQVSGFGCVKQNWPDVPIKESQFRP